MMKRIFTLLFTAVLLIASVSGIHADPTSYALPGHRVYDFLERVEHTYLLPGAHLGTRPLARTEIAGLLMDLAKVKPAFSSADREELEALLDEFSPDYFQGLMWEDEGPVDFLPNFLKNVLYRNRRNMLFSRGDGYSLYADPILGASASVGDLHDGTPDNVYESSNGFRLRGTVGNHVGFHLEALDARQWGDRIYPDDPSTTMPGVGFAAFKGDYAEFDETRGHVSYTGGPFHLSIARGREQWGRGNRGSLMLSTYGAPYDRLRLETSFWRAKFIFFTGELEQYPPVAEYYYSLPEDAVQDSVTVKKYITGHRLEMNISQRLSVGFQETVVFAGGYDLSYLNPMTFLTSVEHSNDDHDNVALGMDFRFYVHRAHSIYGELLIDDITTSKLGTDWYGNKLGYQLGTFLIEPFGLRDMDVRAEYTRLNPWVYTHRNTINSYTHHADVLGHYIGPNSDQVYAVLRKRFSRRLHTSLSYSYLRHGNNPPGKNIGADPLAGHTRSDPDEAGFLDGDVVRTSRVGAAVSYELLWETFVRGSWLYEYRDGDGVNRFTIAFTLNE